MQNVITAEIENEALLAELLEKTQDTHLEGLFSMVQQRDPIEMIKRC